MHVSWALDDIAAVFYVNDTLSAALLEASDSKSDSEGVVAGRAADMVTERSLADQTKLLPPSARGDTWRRLSDEQRTALALSLGSGESSFFSLSFFSVFSPFSDGS